MLNMTKPTKKEIFTDPVLRKAHRHERLNKEGELCPVCKGMCVDKDMEIICENCEGEGVVYK